MGNEAFRLIHEKHIHCNTSSTIFVENTSSNAKHRTTGQNVRQHVGLSMTFIYFVFKFSLEKLKVCKDIKLVIRFAHFAAPSF